MNIECSHFSILQDIVTSHVCRSITVLTVAHQAPRGLATKKIVKFKMLQKEQRLINKTCVSCTCVCMQKCTYNKEKKSTCTCLTHVHTTKEIQRKSRRGSADSKSVVKPIEKIIIIIMNLHPGDIIIIYILAYYVSLHKILYRIL